ncbi:MAG: hypothetical protein SFU98_21600 [Leptospiraceae bacterium]|nr:hypothetical protein [Leptospiraceae bacterium]
MKEVDLKTIKKMFTQIKSVSDPETILQLNIMDVKDELKMAFDDLKIPKFLEPGKYDISVIQQKQDAEPEEVLLTRLVIPEIETEKIEAKEAIQATSLTDSNSFYLELRKQDKEAHERERSLWNTQIETIKDKHSSEIKSIIEKYEEKIKEIQKQHEFEKELIRKNSETLEAERERMTDIIEKRLRGERAVINKQGKRSIFDIVANIIENRPEILEGLILNAVGANAESVQVLEELRRAREAA